MKIAVVGTGYVGMSMATLLSVHNKVYAVDIVPEKVEKINKRISPIADDKIEEFFATKTLDLTAITDADSIYPEVDYVIVSTPTNYDPVKNYFDTSSVESVIKAVTKTGSKATIVVKSTIPVGFTKRIAKEVGTDKLIFAPEFLREGKALYDNLHPSRIIVGVDKENEDQVKKAEIFAKLLSDSSEEENTPILIMGSTEAEAVKLFANTYLALRVSYFNEHTQKVRDLILLTSSTVYVSTPESEATTTTLPSVTAVIAFPRIPNSFWQTLTMFPRTLSRPSFSPTEQERTILPTRYWRRQASMITVRVTVCPVTRRLWESTDLP